MIWEIEKINLRAYLKLEAKKEDMDKIRILVKVGINPNTSWKSGIGQ